MRPQRGWITGSQWFLLLWIVNPFLVFGAFTLAWHWADGRLPTLPYIDVLFTLILPYGAMYLLQGLLIRQYSGWRIRGWLPASVLGIVLAFISSQLISQALTSYWDWFSTKPEWVLHLVRLVPIAAYCIPQTWLLSRHTYLSWLWVIANVAAIWLLQVLLSRPGLLGNMQIPTLMAMFAITGVMIILFVNRFAREPDGYWADKYDA